MFLKYCNYINIFTIVFFLYSLNGFSKKNIKQTQNLTSTETILSKTFIHKIFGKDDSGNFKRNEDKIIETLKNKDYANALLLTQKVKSKAMQIKSDYWICVSYYYLGYIARCEADYTTAIKYYNLILNHNKKPFGNDLERIIKTHNNISDIYKKLNNTDLAIKYYKEAIRLKDKLKDKKVLVSTYINLGSLYSSQKKYPEAKACYLEGLNISSGQNDYKTSIIYNNLGNDQYLLENYTSAINYYLKAIQISEELNELKGLALLYNNIGNIYTNGLKNYNKAIEYFTKSLEIEKNTNNPEGIAWEYLNIGTVYSTLNRFKEAEKTFFEAQKVFKTLENRDGIAKTYENLGALYTLSGNSKKAIDALNACIKICKDEESTQVNMANVYNNMGALYFYQNEYNKALTNYTKALNIAISHEDKDITKRIYSGIKDTYAKLGQYDKAYQYLQYYSDLKDTLLNATISKQIIEMQEKYEKTKMEQKVTMQNLEIKSKSMQRNGITIILILAVLIFSSAIYFILQKRKNEKLFYIKNSRIKDQEIKNLVQQSEIKSMLSMADGQENERQRISRELHDRVGSMLSLIKLNLSNYQTENLPFIHENIELLNNTYQEVRNISHNLHSGLLNQFGLKVALNDLKKSIESSHAIHFNLSFEDNNIIIPRDKEVTIFRILQELITNVLKHASAKNIDIQINNNNNVCSITVEDDGIGFGTKNQKGIGLKNINYRLSSIGGSMELNSQPAKGTFFLLKIPIFDEDKVPIT